MKGVCLSVALACLLIIYIIYIISVPSQTENLVINNLKEKLTIIDPSFDNIDIREGRTSYTEDKSVIYLCLRNENGDIYPLNTVIYVALHEIAHLLNKKDYGHTGEFQSIFDDLLCRATAKGVYNPNLPHGPVYCGVDIRGITMPRCKI